MTSVEAAGGVLRSAPTLLNDDSVAATDRPEPVLGSHKGQTGWSSAIDREIEDDAGKLRP